MSTIKTTNITHGSNSGTNNLILDNTGKVSIAEKKLYCPGTIIQVVSVHKADLFTVAASTGNFSDVTGLSVSITPTASSSKVLIMFNSNYSTTAVNNRGSFRLLRGSTGIGHGTAQSSSISALFPSICTTTSTSRSVPVSTTYLDSPNTTSATTYKIQVGAEDSAGTIYINRNGSNSNSNTDYEGASNLTLMEIAG